MTATGDGAAGALGGGGAPHEREVGAPEANGGAVMLETVAQPMVSRVERSVRLGMGVPAGGVVRVRVRAVVDVQLADHDPMSSMGELSRRSRISAAAFVGCGWLVGSLKTSERVSPALIRPGEASASSASSARAETMCGPDGRVPNEPLAATVGHEEPPPGSVSQQAAENAGLASAGSSRTRAAPATHATL